jgi:hypothetical protein
MDIEEAIRDRLVADATLAARLPAYLDSKTVFWGERPQGSAMPAIVLNTVSRPVAEHMKGAQRLQFMRTQLDTYGDDPATAQQIADIAAAVMMPRAFGEHYYFRPSSILNRRDLQEPAATGTIFRTWLDLMVRFSPA